MNTFLYNDELRKKHRNAWHMPRLHFCARGVASYYDLNQFKDVFKTWW